MAFLDRLQHLAVFEWIAGSDTIWGYPIILTLHTVGFALVVGAAVVMDLRLLGLAQRAPVTAFAFLFRVMWIGFGVNALTGSILFAIAATTKAVQVVFWIKLALVAVALLITKLIASAVRRPPDYLDDFVVPRRARVLAVLSLLASVDGLMAYIK